MKYTNKHDIRLNLFSLTPGTPDPLPGHAVTVPRSVETQELVAVYDAEVPELKNVPIQDLNVTIHECIAPTAHLVIASDNDPCSGGGVVVPTDDIAVGASCVKNCGISRLRKHY